MAINQRVYKCLQLIVSLIKLGYVKWDSLLINENKRSNERMEEKRMMGKKVYGNICWLLHSFCLYYNFAITQIREGCNGWLKSNYDFFFMCISLQRSWGAIVWCQNNMQIYSVLTSCGILHWGASFVCQVYLESTQVCPTFGLATDLGLLTSMCII